MSPSYGRKSEDRIRTTARVDKGRNGKESIESDKRIRYEQIPVWG